MDEKNPLEKLRIENDKLKRLNSFKTDLISINAHQLRTSLSAMKWILKMFIDKDLGELNKEQESFMEKTYESNERMIKLVNEMLDSNKEEPKQIEYDFESLDIVDLIDDTLFDFKGEAYKKNIDVIFLKPDEETFPLVHADREKIRSVLQNLIENALKYSEEGDRVFITIKKDSGYVQVSIKDTGIGIKEEYIKNLFGKFFRVRNDNDQINGSGLGLFACKNIIEKHDGEIWVESKLGIGSTFYFTLLLSTEKS
ncbi:MAG: HAMP domain-containing sensor histidine kinase [Candidatus Paceibacterota bacterium]|jgi:signal transduction histidine kinase